MVDRRPLVLLVEAHPVFRRELGLLLGAAGLRVRGVATIAESMTSVDRAVPDLAVVADRLPDGEGLRLCRILTQQHPGIRVVIHATLITEQLREQALAAGACAVVLKGYRCEELLAQVAALRLPG